MVMLPFVPERGDETSTLQASQHHQLLAKDASLTFATMVNKALTGDQGLLRLRGKAAVQSRETVISQLQYQRRKLIRQLPSTAARQLFDDLIAPRLAEGFARIEQHAKIEQSNWTRETHEAGIDALISEAVVDGVKGGESVREVIQHRLSLVETEILASHHLSELDGTPSVKERAATEIQEAGSAIHAGVVEQLLIEGAPEPARDYLARNRALLTRADRERVTPMVQDRLTSLAATRVADKFWQQQMIEPVPDKEVRALKQQLSATLARIDRLDNAELRKKARSYIIGRHRTETNAARRTRQNLWARALKFVQDGEPPQNLPHADIAALGSDSAERLHRIFLSGGEHNTSAKGCLTIASLLNTPVHEFINIDVTEYSDELSKQDLQRLAKRQNLLSEIHSGKNTGADPWNRTADHHFNHVCTLHQLDKPNLQGLSAGLRLAAMDALNPCRNKASHFRMKPGSSKMQLQTAPIY